MFGVNQDTKSSQLYLLYDMAKKQLSSLKTEINDLKDSDDPEKRKELENQITYLEKEIAEFEVKLANELEAEFSFSTEEIYCMFGQYEDNFISVEFHRNTESYEKYGDTVGGTIVYSKSERASLENEINSGTPKRTNGYVKLSSTKNYQLNDEQRKELLETGFKSSDVYEILELKLPKVKTYGQPGMKEVPNRVNIEMDLSSLDSHALKRFNVKMLLDDGKQPRPYELLRYFALVEDVNPTGMEEEGIYDLIESWGEGAKHLFMYHQLKVSIENNQAEDYEKAMFLNIRRSIIKSRLEDIKKEVRKSANKPLELYIKENPEFLLSFAKETMTFEEESLEFLQSGKPIYWDFKSVAHIYLRHTSEVDLKGVNELKSKFQYEIKEVRYLLKKCIEDNIDGINQRLSTGKDFRLFGDCSYYYNGNYYCLNIDKDGRVSSFYPNDPRKNKP